MGVNDWQPKTSVNHLTFQNLAPIIDNQFLLKTIAEKFEKNND